MQQTYDDFELIILDNASSDRTQTICQEYAQRDSRLSYYRNGTNIGAGPNFNEIVSYSQCKYFKWLAHDDVIAPTFLERCIDALERDSSAVLACPRVRFIDENGAALEDYISPFRTSDADPMIRFQDMLYGHRCFEIFGVIRRRALVQTNLIGNYNHGDGVLLAHLALLGHYIDIHEPLFYSRRHREQSMFVYGVTDNESVPDFEAYANWFDPGNRIGLSLSFNRLLKEYAWMVQRAPLKLAQRLTCHRFLCRWFFRHFRIIVGEWKRAVYHMFNVPYKPRQYR